VRPITAAVATFGLFLPGRGNAIERSLSGDEMLTLARALQALEDAWSAEPSTAAPGWNTPVQFDAALISGLVFQYDELSTRVDGLTANRGADAEDVARRVIDCAEDLHRLRHIEALQLYPLVARGLSPDPVARRLFWQSRLVMLGLARRAFRRFDELVRAVRSENGVTAAVDHVTKALAEYRQRNETEIFPLYGLAGRRNDSVGSSAA
jgi:hypothetical protein